MHTSHIIFDPIQSSDQARVVFDLLRCLAHQIEVELKPTPSEPTSCCGKGCEGCVWIAFFEAAERWRQSVISALGLSPSNFSTVYRFE